MAVSPVQASEQEKKVCYNKWFYAWYHNKIKSRRFSKFGECETHKEETRRLDSIVDTLKKTVRINLHVKNPHREKKDNKTSGKDMPVRVWTDQLSAYITVNVSDIGVFLYDLLLCL